MKKLLTLIISLTTSSTFATCQDGGNFASPVPNKPVATSRCTYTISKEIATPNNDNLRKFWQDIRTDYSANHTTRDFVVINSTTNEVYHLNAGDLYLDGIGNGIPDNNYNFKDLSGRNEYAHLSGKNSQLRINNVKTALSINYLNGKDAKANLNLNNIDQNLRALITAIPEAVKFQSVSTGLYTDKVTAAWVSSYEPIVTTWQKTLDYRHYDRGHLLTLEDTLDYLKSTGNTKDLNDINANISCPVYGKNCPIVGATKLFF